MTPAQIRLVRNSFAKIEPTAKQVGEKFFDRFFRLAPETRALFKSDMSLHHEKFMAAIGQLATHHLRCLLTLPVTQLDNAEAAMPAMRKLGQAHAQLGVNPDHFPVMRRCLVETFEDVLGDEFTPSLRDAWLAAYDIMTKAMLSGLLDTGPAAPEFLGRLDGVKDDGKPPKRPLSHVS